MGTFPTPGRTLPRQQRGPTETNHDQPSTRVAPYLRVPDRLLRTYAHDPLTVGVYLAIARCVLALQAATPLSPADLADWTQGRRTRDLTLMRRIRSLIDAGWLRTEPGRAVKLRLLPTWGNLSMPWQFDDPHLGKAEGLRVRRVPLELFDTYLGRIDPQPGRRPALITRYVDRPLLGLADLGVYAISQITDIAPTAPLLALGLVSAHGPQPPQSLVDLLTAVANGRVQLSDGASDGSSDSTVRLSLQGRARVGARNGSPSGSCSGSRNGSYNGSQDGAYNQEPCSSLERDETYIDHEAAAVAWDGWDRRIEGSESPTPYVTDSTRGRGQVIRLPAESFRPARLDPERDQLLTAMGIRQKAALAHVSLELITAWQDALQHPGMAARFDDPVAVAATQLRREIPPPTVAELERWARGPEQRGKRGDIAQSYAPVVEFDAARQVTLLAQARAITGDGDDLLVGYVVSALAEGMDAISALIHAQREVERQLPESSEEVYRALRTRATR